MIKSLSILKEEVLNQHFNTLLYQIKCRILQQEKMSEKPIKTIPGAQRKERQGAEAALHIQVV